MKLPKLIIIISLSVLVVSAAWKAEGSLSFPQTWLPERSVFSGLFSQPSEISGADYSTDLLGVSPLFQHLLQIIREDSVRQILPSAQLPASAKTNKTKDSGYLFAVKKSFYGYFWDTSGRFNSTNGRHGIADLAYSFGQTTPHFYLGHENAKNSDDWKVGDIDSTRMMYGVSLDYKVSNAFYVIPVITYYDWINQTGGASKPGLNKEWIGGLQFRFLF